jgi:RecG-like helicase
MRHLMEMVVEYWAPNVADALPESVRSSAGLMSLNEALLQVHFPKSQEKLLGARERLVFDEIFYLQMIVLRQKREWKSEYAKRFSVTDIKLIEKARSEAQRLFDDDSELSRSEHSLLADVLESFWAVGRQNAG